MYLNTVGCSDYLSGADESPLQTSVFFQRNRGSTHILRKEPFWLFNKNYGSDKSLADFSEKEPKKNI